MNKMRPLLIVSIFFVIFISGCSAFAASDIFTKMQNGLKWMIDDVHANTSLKSEFASKLTPKTLYDFKYHEYLAGADLSLASYRIIVMNAGWAKSVETVNTRGIATLGATMELNRSQTAIDYVKKILPNADYGFLKKLSLGSFVGYDFDRDNWRYGGYLGLSFDGLDLK